MNAMQPPQSIEEIKAGLETTEKGGVRQSIRNCLTVFQRDPLLSGAIAYNILTDRKDIIKPIGFHRESTALNDTDMKYLLLYLEETYGLTNEKKIDNAIGIVANENKYHPIRDYLSALVWDGTERIRFCLRHFLGADADDYTYEALKLFLLGAISRAFQPGCKFEIMLCLVGGQGAGKSTFFRLLAVRDEWFSDDLRKLDDDNVYRKLQGHWIIEMSEMMATANAKSIEEIKSFLSRQKEVYKIPYETHPADRPRQCVFGGTSNALDFLPLDRSGNRRFIPVMVYPEQAEVHILEDEAASRAYIEQMWAEAMEIYRSGRFKLAFSPTMQRYLKEHQRDFMPEDTKAGMIQAYVDESVATEEPAVEEKVPETEPEEPMLPLTPDGNLTLVDDAGSPTKSGKQFITAVTKNGNYFYIIIDRDDKGEETVHFLNQVDEADLLKLMDEEEVAEFTKPVEETKPEVVETVPEITEPTPEEKPKSTNMLPAILTLIVLACGGGFFVFKKVQEKKKAQEAAKPDPDADYVDDDEDYGYDPEFEDDDEDSSVDEDDNEPV